MLQIFRASIRHKRHKLFGPNLHAFFTTCGVSLVLALSLITSSASATILDAGVVNSLPREVQDVINDFAQTQGQPRLPTVQEVEQNVDSVSNDSKLTDEEKTRIKDALQKVLTLLQSYNTAIEDKAILDEKLSRSKETLEQLGQELTLAEQEYAKQPDVSGLKSKSIDELSTLIAKVSQQLDQSHKELSDATAEYNSLQSLPTRVQSTLSSNNDRIYNIVDFLSNRSATLSNYEKQALALEAFVLQLESAILEQRSHSLTFFQDEANYKIRISNLKKEFYTQYLSNLRQLQNELITAQAASSSTQNNEEDFKQIPKLQHEVKINSQYTDDINQTTLDNTQLNTELRNVTNALNTVYQLEKVMNDQISDISESLLLSRLLNRQQSEIPNVTISFNLDEMLTDLTLSLFDLRVQRDVLFDIDQYVAHMIDIDPQLAPYTEQLRQLMQHRRSLIEQLYQLRSESLSLSISLRDKYQEFTKTATNVNSVINDHLFWLASNSGISIDFFTNFLSNITNQVQSFAIKFTNPEKSHQRLLRWFTVFVPIVLIALIFYKITPFFKKRLNCLALRLDKPNDSYWVTPCSLLYHLFCIMPLMATLTACGMMIIFIVLDDFRHQLEITASLAMHLICFLYIRHIFEQNSLAQRHFCFSCENNRRILQVVDKIWFISIPMLLIANMRILEPTVISSDLIGYTLMLLGFLYLTIFAFKTAKNRFESDTPTMSFWIMSTVGILTPLTLTLMLALGYYYTVIQVLNRVAISLYIFFLYFITSNTLRRELYVAENRMLMQARQRLLSKKDNESFADKEQNNNRKIANSIGNALANKRSSQVQTMRLDLVSSNSFKLFNGFILCVFLYFMYLQWNDLAGVLTYLNNVYLWTKTSIVEGKEIITNYLSLGHLLLAIIIIIVTTLLAKNLPNLLERLFLLRSSINNKSTSYTVKIISFYFITTVGIILAAGVMGISWDNLQWLVAALSVGLGFGLQEIFGNFVSGIIILFERQLRVGDIVTLNSLSGTVSKIRIRATTIIAFDNKEVVIPNKQFITSALTNWSLSNTITKLEFEVGIAYNADINKAKDLLRNIMRRCKNLNRDKKPVVYVKSLDASAITLLCEVYVNEIGKRKETFDFLSTETLRLFGEHNIEIPFDQLDVTIRNLDNGQTLTETQVDTIKAISKKNGTSVSMKQSTNYDS